MTYASIMVAMDLTDGARNRVRLAGRLADDFNARLIGVAAEQPAYVVPPVGPTPASAYALADSGETVLNDLRVAHEAFAAAAGGRNRLEWRSNLDVPVAFLAAQSAAADLVVVGRGVPGPPCSRWIRPMRSCSSAVRCWWCRRIWTISTRSAW